MLVSRTPRPGGVHARRSLSRSPDPCPAAGTDLGVLGVDAALCNRTSRAIPAGSGPVPGSIDGALPHHPLRQGEWAHARGLVARAARRGSRPRVRGALVPGRGGGRTRRIPHYRSRRAAFCRDGGVAGGWEQMPRGASLRVHAAATLPIHRRRRSPAVVDAPSGQSGRRSGPARDPGRALGHRR